MAFDIKRKENFDYNTPQEMYQDNKMKKIRGLLDYQSAMIDEYMKNIDSDNVALELPTGSGKTLIGLLIGEYRRRKFKETIVFLCPTRQLVNQVVEQAQEKFGIKATAFVGSQNEYSEKDKTDFARGNTIAVTTYSAFFTQYMFKDVDVAILDDVHSSEEYIISNWTLQITDDDPAYNEMLTILKNILSHSNYERLTTNDKDSSEISNWCELIPMPRITKISKEIYNCLNNSLEKYSNNYYAWQNICDNIEDCNF